MTPGAHERTPLLANGNGHAGSDDKPARRPWWAVARFKAAGLGLSPANRVLLAGFIISLSFTFTQVSIFYIFYIMECDVYYETHPPYTGPGDRCSRNEIAAGTATQFSLLGISTTFCGTWNLFVSGWQVKRWGPRAALVLQTVVPAIRVAAQMVGVVAGGQAGIWIIQTTQVITILGGPAGYILVLNTIAGEVVEPAARTGLFGRLQGVTMLANALGFLIGGLIGDTFGIIRPFQTAFVSFCLASVYAQMAMPYISPESLSDGRKPRSVKGIRGFFAPLKVLAPQRLRLKDGTVKKHYGVFFLCCGVFIGVLATGYAPILLQMYATATFDFDQANNGWLLSSNSFMRAVFLIFIFPRIIDRGRIWWSGGAAAETAEGQPASLTTTTATTTATAPPQPKRNPESPATDDDDIPTQPEEFEAPLPTQVEEEPVVPKRIDEKSAFAFDLFFLRWSLLVDGALTAGAGFATQGWHMYLGQFCGLSWKGWPSYTRLTLR